MEKVPSQPNLFGTSGESGDAENPLDAPKKGYRPLADRMRPRTLAEYVGQEHILGRNSVLRHAIENDAVQSVMFWGPPGTGKTTLAHIIAHETGARFVHFSAVTSGVKEVRAAIARATEERRESGKRTILFVDEIHRFNKAQQDAFLPHIENGTVILIGATTENPSFEVNSALLSRSRVFVLKSLTAEHLETLLRRALEDKERGLGKKKLWVEDDAVRFIAEASHGDARVALTALEMAASSAPVGDDGVARIDEALAADTMQKKTLLYDKSGDEHFNTISALHKSMRGSDPDAALYWMARMLEAGDDPLYVARRVVRFASEDIGCADPQALQISLAAFDTYHRLGSPEGELAIAQAVVYCATAPKSAAVYKAYGQVRADVEKHGALPVPLHIRNAPTRLMKDLDYGKDYKYAHDDESGYIAQEYLPDELRGTVYYHPTNRGHEKIIRKRLDWWAERKREAMEGKKNTGEEKGKGG